MPEPAPLPGEPRPDLAEHLRMVAAHHGRIGRVIAEADFNEAADALDALAQRVAVLESLVERLAHDLRRFHDGELDSSGDCPGCPHTELLTEAEAAVEADHLTDAPHRESEANQAVRPGPTEHEWWCEAYQLGHPYAGVCSPENPTHSSPLCRWRPAVHPEAGA